MRENNIVQCEEPIKIKILNLSVGGMLFTSTTDFCVGDTIVFNFDYYKNNVIPIEAKIIRIDEPSDEFSNYSYGCIFKGLSDSDESVLYQYLYERQLQVHKKNNY
jgi:c-di-GMP-binding flagellar brake protein YcgR